MRHVFLVNPAAGQQDQTARFTAMADSLHRRHSRTAPSCAPTAPGSAEAAAARLAQTRRAAAAVCLRRRRHGP